MKKIGILTFHRALNYGAVLQTYALENVINSLCDNAKMKVEIIDYRCNLIDDKRKIRNKIYSFNIFKLFVLLYKKYIFNKFLKNINISKEKYDKSNINLLETKYYKFIVGSDQVWNYKITGKDYTYLLDFVKNSNKKYSYAASLGIELNEEIDNYKKLLSRFNNISVRETDTKKIFTKELKLRDIDVHLDPTLLLTQSQWKKLFNIKKNEKEYILVYNILSSPNSNEIVKSLSLENKLKIIDISVGTKKNICKTKFLIPNVSKFLSLIFNAKYVITNSFHGMVFAIIFKKNFLVELKQNQKTNSRIISLLKILNLEDRIINSKDYKKIYENIDWKNVFEQLDIERKKSLEYLLTIINK